MSDLQWFIGYVVIPIIVGGGLLKIVIDYFKKKTPTPSSHIISLKDVHCHVRDEVEDGNGKFECSPNSAGGFTISGSNVSGSVYITSRVAIPQGIRRVEATLAPSTIDWGACDLDAEGGTSGAWFDIFDASGQSNTAIETLVKKSDNIGDKRKGDRKTFIDYQRRCVDIHHNKGSVIVALAIKHDRKDVPFLFDSGCIDLNKAI